MKKLGINAFVSAALSISLVFAGLLSFMPQVSFATEDSCNQEFPYTKDNDFEDSRVEIDINDYDGDDDRQVVIDPKSNYKIIFIGVDYTGNDDNDATPSVGDGYTTITYNAPNNQSIDHVTVTLKKICASSTPTQVPTATPTTAPTATPDERKVTICHATSSEQNPWTEITASYNAIYNPNAGHFNEPGTPASGHEDDIEGPCPTATSQPSNSPTATPTTVPTSVPTESPCDGDCEPTSTPVATETPNSDLCANIEGIQYSVPEGKHLDASGKNCVEFGVPGSPESPATSGQVLGTSTSGQVLGASTMAGTGALEDAILNSIFTLGSLLTSFGIMKNGKKKS